MKHVLSLSLSLSLSEKKVNTVKNETVSVMKRLYFSTEFVDWILKGKKRATTRVKDFIDEDGDREIAGDLKKGDVVEAADDDDRVFAALEIESVRTLRFDALDDDLARTENFDNAEHLQKVLLRFYKDLKNDSSLVVVHFHVVRS